jgi:hemerythrin
MSSRSMESVEIETQHNQIMKLMTGIVTNTCFDDQQFDEFIIAIEDHFNYEEGFLDGCKSLYFKLQKEEHRFLLSQLYLVAEELIDGKFTEVEREKISKLFQLFWEHFRLEDAELNF